MIRFIAGKPGGGKSYRGVQIIIDELRLTKRKVCTNLSVNVEELADYLHRHYDDSFDLVNRLRILTNDECVEFFKHYGPGQDLDARIPVRQVDGTCYQHIDYSPRFEPIKHPGTLFVIDEVHEFFNARDWTKSGKDALHYLSQHRKLGDDVICITQSVQHVEKQFRNLAQDFTVCRNLKKEKFPILAGIIKAPSTMVRASYLSAPTGAPGERAQEVRTVKLDPEICKCYDTSGGVGISGGGNADVHEKNRGLPFWTIPIFFIALIWVLDNGIDFTAKKLGGAADSVAESPSKSQVAGQPAEMGYLSRLVPGVGGPGQSNAVAAVAVAAETNEVFITSVTTLRGTVRVGLSDGRQLTEKDITAVSRNYVFAGTERFRVKGGGVIGIPGMRRSPVATSHPYPVEEKVTQRNLLPVVTNEVREIPTPLNQPGSAMLPRGERTQWQEPAWQNLPMRGLAVP